MVLGGMRSKEALEERCGRIGDAGDFVGRLTIELAVDLRLRADARKIAERSQFDAAEGPGGRIRALHSQADATTYATNGLGYDAPRIEAASAYVLCRENEDLIARADVLAAPHGL